MPVSTIGLITFFSILAAVQHYRNLPETTEKATEQAEKQMRYDEKNRQLDAELEAERLAKLNPTPTPKETLIPNIWTPIPYPTAVPQVEITEEITPEPTPTVEPVIIPIYNYKNLFNISNKPPKMKDYKIIYFKTEETNMKYLFNICVMGGAMRQYKKFTCQKGNTVIFYFEKFPIVRIVNGEAREEELLPTWTNAKEVTND